MAQQTAIKIRRSAVAGKAPATTDLVLGELALNTNDGVLYFKKSPSGVDSIVALKPIGTGSGLVVGDTSATLNSPTLNNAVFQQTFSIGTQVFYPHTNGFSVNENFDITNQGSQANFTGYHFASGAGKSGTAFTLARSGYFTDGFGVTGDASNNQFVIGSETYNTDFVFKNGIGMPFDVSGGTTIFSVNRDGSLTFADTTVQTTAWLGSVNQLVNGTKTLKLNSDGSVQFPNYKFPAAAGTNGQILSSDGAGNVSWISNSSTSPATSTSLGVVQVDGTTIVANGSGVISARSLVNGSYSAVLDSTGTLTVNNLTVNATTTVNSQTLVVQGIGNLLLSQDGQYLTLPNGQTIASNNAYNVAIIGANSGSFYFSSGGTLKLPPNGDIIDSNGNSVLNLNGRVVSYGVTQNLTSTQQLTARSNIGLDDATLYFYCYMFG